MHVKVITKAGYNFGGKSHPLGETFYHPRGAHLDAALHFKQVALVAAAPGAKPAAAAAPESPAPATPAKDETPAKKS